MDRGWVFRDIGELLVNFRIFCYINNKYFKNLRYYQLGILLESIFGIQRKRENYDVKF